MVYFAETFSAATVPTFDQISYDLRYAIIQFFDIFEKKSMSINSTMNWPLMWFSFEIEFDSPGVEEEHTNQYHQLFWVGFV